MARRRSNKNFVAIPVEGSLSLSTLAFGAVLESGLIGSDLTEDLYAISVDLDVEVTGLTAGEGEPMMVYVAHSDYSSTEINEHIDVTFLGPGNKIEQERARRLVRIVGQLKSESEAATRLKMPTKRTKLKFVIQNGKILSIAVNNRSGAALTTGATLRWSGKIYGRWIL